MKDKKLDVKKAILQKMSQGLREDSKKNLGEGLKAKKLQKVTILAPDEEGLEKGLSTAQKLLKAKYGEMGLDEADMDDEESEHECPMCAGAGCEHCEEEEEQMVE